MRVSRQQAEKNREHVIDVASRLFRERGFDGIGLSDLMNAAGLTRGAFYGQFRSKADLEVRSSERAINENLYKLRQAVSADAARPLLALVTYYLSTTHRDATAGGCALAALGPDAAREGQHVRSVFTCGIEAHLELFRDVLGASAKPSGFDDAVGVLATLVGAIVLARTINDDALSREVLAAATRTLVTHYSSELGSDTNA
ncbi:TetR family transcriptional regulator [Ensifer adhaerens]|uniref:TetR family transcriptional regulator n=1 Tax=Ensifer adhaerens TaxID=106592 RepID=UPI001CBE1D8B|nr:TetR family transcriptional regulator [Ensifer adhaerens]MBZ7924293.1 TetR family transcriptional regulator [Ensifer adhaerens]UAX96456.1 TetR family transcriptional regulator [Ensifer adhaerens]UAY04201.1 TetR family transcriptional regulator [Ensifer adhaerens]UAY12187.1 TetR family transcriptional regulator [Ensifer adhaerens]